MGYYCTVPQCTSLAGKTKNVKFHRFPRDVNMADKWNIILKRGKPYTKYSKVCSLHFTQADYNVTTMGQWKTLSKDAVPSQTLPKLNPDGTVMVIRKSRTVKYREGRKDSVGDKCEKWSTVSHSVSQNSGLPTNGHLLDDPNTAYRLQTLSAIASALPPQLPLPPQSLAKPKKQDAFMQTDPIQSEDDDLSQPNNSYSEASDTSFNSEQHDYQKEQHDYQKDQHDYQKDQHDYQKDYLIQYKEKDYPIYHVATHDKAKDYKYENDTKYDNPKDYTPKPDDYTPKDDYISKPDDYTPKPDDYTPKSEDFTPKSDGYTPKPENYTPRTDSYTPKPQNYTKQEDYIPQTNEEYNKEAEKYALERKSLNGYDKHTIDYQKHNYQKPDYQKHDYQKQAYQKHDYQKVTDSGYQMIPEYMGYSYPDSVEMLRNQQHNLEMLQQQHRINENQNFFNENHIKVEIDMNSEEEKFLYERAKDQLDANAMYTGHRSVVHQQRLLEHLQQQVKQEPDGCENVLQPQGSPYYGPNGHTNGTGGYYDQRPGPELLIAKQNALAAHTQLWQNTMKRPFFYSETPAYSSLHRYEDLTRILQ